MLYKMDLEVCIKGEPAFRKDAASISFEHCELVPEMTNLKEEFYSELMELEHSRMDTVEPSADVKDEIIVKEKTVGQLVPCSKEENINLDHNGGHMILNKYSMPAPGTAGTKSPAGARPAVEAVGLHAGDISALAVQHAGDQLSSEWETSASIQAELGFDTTVGVEDSSKDQDLDACEDSSGPLGIIESVVSISDRNHGWGETPSPEAILPEITEETTQEMDIHDIAVSPSPEQELKVQLSSSPSHHQLSGSCNGWNMTPISVTSGNSPTAGLSIIVIQSPDSPSTSGVPASVSVSGCQISGLSSNVPQFQSIIAKSADGNIVQRRPPGISKQGGVTTSSNFTPGTSQATIKRLATSGCGDMRNVYAKVIITGNQHNQQDQPIMLATSQSEDTFTAGQPVKVISGSSGQGTHLASPTKTISHAQFQRVRLITRTELQHIMTASANKQSIIVNKLVSRPSKITMMPASTVVKSPTKILPEPVSDITQLKPATVSVATVSGVKTAVTTVNTDVKPLTDPQKVVIRQDPLKPGILMTLSAESGQCTRIPATQNLTQLHTPQGGQLQNVHLVSAAESNTSTVSRVMTEDKPQTTTMVPVTSVSVSRRPVTLSSVCVPEQTIKMVHVARATPAVRTAASKSPKRQPGQRISMPASSAASQLQPDTNVTLPATAVNKLTSGAAGLPSGTSSYILLPAHYVQQLRNLRSQQSKQQPQLQPQLPHLSPSQAQPQQQSVLKIQNIGSTLCHTCSDGSSILEPIRIRRTRFRTRTILKPNGIPPRKHCNCTKSQCLKLYCDCFANGEFCNMCNCYNCFNNEEHEEDRQRGIKACLERNPYAFQPKIGKGIVGDEKRQNKGCRTILEPNGIPPRKHCNCTKSQCLKLYCDCFANGEFCNMCNCNNCFNNEEHEEDRQRGIKACLERNPYAFQPKIGKGIVGDERRHNKGCNCRRSGCLKNYCECFEAKIPCSNKCRCVGCQNVETYWTQ